MLMHVRLLFLALVAFRSLNALLCQTAFVPDEYWQSLEVAHRTVFGYGYLTWEWQKGIRGYTHPLIFALLYKCLQLIGMDWPYLLIILPRLLQAVCAAVADICLYKVACKMYRRCINPSVYQRLQQHVAVRPLVLFTLLCSIFNWFTFYCVVRTLTSSLETVLGSIGVYLLYHKLFTAGVGVAAFSCLIRPTAAVFWIPVIITHLYKMNSNERLKCILKTVVLSGSAICWSLVVDRMFYGQWTFVQYRFVLFNVFEGRSAFYGTHPWHWYFSQGAPVVLFSLYPSFLLGGLQVGNHESLYFVSLWYIVIHSLLQHKEFRFIFPIVPFACIYAGYYLHTVWTKYKHNVYKCAVVLMLISNIPMAMYFSLIHQRGSLAVMDELRLAINDYPSPSVLFLTPCHSTPFYSHVHRNISMRILTCSPFEKYNELEQFYNDPHQWLNTQYPSPEDLPTHLIMYNSLTPTLEQFLSDNHYNKISEVFHTHIVDDDRVGQYLQIHVKR